MRSDGWQIVQLRDVCDAKQGIQTGPFGSQLHAADYVTDGIPSIMPADLKEGRVTTEQIARITEEDASRLSRYLVEPGDVVYSRRGDVTRCGRITDDERGWLCGTGCLRVRSNRELVDPLFLFYRLNHPDTRQWISSRAVGTSMPNLNTTILGDVPFALPHLAEQRRISSVLGTLDSKIESLRATADTAQDWAEAQYGLLLATGEDLEECAIGDLVERLNKSVQPKSSPAVRYEHFSIPAYDENGMPDICLGDSMLSAKNDISSVRCVLFSKLNPEQKRVWWVEVGDGAPRVASPEFVALTERVPGALPFVWAALRADDRVRRHLLGKTTGTTGSRQRIKPTDITSTPIRAPSGDELSTWGAAASAALTLSDSSLRQARTITALRDALLPKLIVGDIRVSGSEDLQEAGDTAGETQPDTSSASLSVRDENAA